MLTKEMAQEWLGELDDLRIGALRLAPDGAVDLFARRDRLIRKLRHLFEHSGFEVRRRARRECADQLDRIWSRDKFAVLR